MVVSNLEFQQATKEEGKEIIWPTFRKWEFAKFNPVEYI